MAWTMREMETSQRPRSGCSPRDRPCCRTPSSSRCCCARAARARVVDEAHRLLHDAGGLIHVARMDVSELTRRRGLGPAKAATLVARSSSAQRVLRDRLRDGRRLDTRMPPASSWRRGSPASGASLRVPEPRRPAPGHPGPRGDDGTRTQAPVDPAEVFRRALLDDAAALVVFHNHPSGELEPSRTTSA